MTIKSVLWPAAIAAAFTYNLRLTIRQVKTRAF